MSHWHEPVKITGGISIHPPTGKVGAVIRRSQDDPQTFVAYFMRHEREGKALLWSRFPEGWFELHPREPITGKSSQELRERVLALMPQVEAGSLDEQFERNPYLPPKRPDKVKEIEHLTHQAKAVIVKHEEKRYEVGYMVYAPDGKYFPVSTPSIGILGWEWGRARMQTVTLADDIESAEQIATLELNEIVDEDPSIKLRDAA